MTVHDLLADGQLADAVAFQETVVAASPSDHTARRLLVDLLAFAGEFDAALDHLARIHSDEPEWPEVERSFHRLFRSERFRTLDSREPTITPDPPPRHATQRWKAMKAIRRAEPQAAVKAIDDADAVSKHLRGFIDGREFDGLRDADDRFASVLEAFRGGEYLWVPWEAMRKVRLAPATVLLDQLYRAATITFRDGTTMEVHLPLVYPSSYRVDGAFALGIETDYICPDNGPTRCIGSKLLLVNDDDEVMLSECGLIEMR